MLKGEAMSNLKNQSAAVVMEGASARIVDCATFSLPRGSMRATLAVAKRVLTQLRRDDSRGLLRRTDRGRFLELAA